MTDLLRRVDPAADAQANRERIRALTEEKLGISPPVLDKRRRRGWAFAVAGVVVVLAVVVPIALLQSEPEPVLDPVLEQTVLGIHGVTDVVPLGGGSGVQTMAVDGDDVWIASANTRELHLLDASTAEMVGRYRLDHYVEGLAVGGGYVWLIGYGVDSEAPDTLLRFNPDSGSVDLEVPFQPGPSPNPAWIGDELWVNTASGITRFSADGDVIDTSGAEVSEMVRGGEAGTTWVLSVGRLDLVTGDGPLGLDIEAGSLLAGDEGQTPVGAEGAGGGRVIRQLTMVGDHLWLIDEANDELVRYDIQTNELATVDAGAGLHSLVSTGDSIWVTSHDDYTLTQIDEMTLEVLTATALPGRPGTMVEADGSLWVGLHQAGALVGFDPRAAGLQEPAPVITDGMFGGIRLRCTGTGDGPTVLLDPDGYGGFLLGAGSWSVVQAELSDEATVCSYDPRGTYAAQGSSAPGGAQERVDDLASALDEAGVDGPYLLVAHGHGTFSSLLFIDEMRDEVDGLVLVDPIPIGYTDLHTSLLPEIDLGSDDSHLIEGLDDLGDLPLTVIGHDPDATFLNEGFLENPGATPEIASQINDFWQEGLEYYASLSTNSKRETATGSNHVVIWYRPDVVVDAVQEMLGG